MKICIGSVSLCYLSKELKDAISHPYLMRDGGILGLASHYMYIYSDLHKTEDLPGLLKGADLLVYVYDCQVPGLSVIVKPVVKKEWSHEQILSQCQMQ